MSITNLGGSLATTVLGHWENDDEQERRPGWIGDAPQGFLGLGIERGLVWLAGVNLASQKLGLVARTVRTDATAYVSAVSGFDSRFLQMLHVPKLARFPSQGSASAAFFVLAVAR